MASLESTGFTIEEMIDQLRMQGWEITRDQFRRWYQSGLLEPPICRRRGRGRGAGWQAGRFPSTVQARLTIIAEISGLEIGQRRTKRIPIPYQAWKLWRSGFTVPENLLRKALLRVIRIIKKQQTKLHRNGLRLSDDVIDHHSRFVSPAIRNIKKRLDTRGPHANRLSQHVFEDLADVLEGKFSGPLSSQTNGGLQKLIPSSAWPQSFLLLDSFLDHEALNKTVQSLDGVSLEQIVQKFSRLPAKITELNKQNEDIGFVRKIFQSSDAEQDIVNFLLFVHSQSAFTSLFID